MTSLKVSSPSDVIGYFYLSFLVSLSFSLSVITPLTMPLKYVTQVKVRYGENTEKIAANIEIIFHSKPTSGEMAKKN